VYATQARNTNAGMHVTPNEERARSQRYTKDSVYLLAKMTLCAMALRTFPHFVGQSVILGKTFVMDYEGYTFVCFIKI